VSRVRLSNISKRFGSNQALDDVSLELREGEILALLGENGAGKSTLMNVLYGLIQPDNGTIRVDDRELRFASPSDAIRAGIGMVHQHFMLIPNLTVAENVLMGSRADNPFWFRRARAVDEVRVLSTEFGLDVDPRSKVSELPVGVQQRVEILKCLARRARVLILDEPTAVLTPHEADDLGAVLSRLRDSGQSIIFISHKLREVVELCDRVTVLRLGKHVATVDTDDVDEQQLGEMMVGRVVRLGGDEGSRPERELAPSQPVLRVRGLRVHDERSQPAVRDVDLTVNAGEIVGIAGIDGNGQLELAECLAGVRRTVAGDVMLMEHALANLSPRRRAELGMAVITEDRQLKGLILDFSVAENLVLRAYRSDLFAAHGFLQPRTVARHARDLADRFAIRATTVRQPVGSLSGGNQQKVVLARELTAVRRLLIAVNPTRGLDIGATEYVHDALRHACDEGVGILLISTELDEVLSLSDRIGVLFRGSLRELPPGTAEVRAIVGQWMLGLGAAS